MKRKTSETPTRVYVYGCLPPVSGVDVFEEQLRLAHRYRNSLVEIERRRRDRVNEAQLKYANIAALVDDVYLLDTFRAEAERAIKAAKAGKSREVRDTFGEVELYRAVLGQLKEARGRLKDAKAALRDNVVLNAEYKVINEKAKEELKAARKTSGVYWGTYLKVEASVEQASRSSMPPGFQRYTGEGLVAVQLQNGLTVSEALGGEDTRLRIGGAVARAPTRLGRPERAIGAREAERRKSVWLRVGSDGRVPVWVTLPMIYHRPLPSDGKIMWAAIHRRKVGLRFEYRLLVTLESETFAPAASSGQGTVAIDLGWRMVDGNLRVGYWCDDRGEHGQIACPEKTITGIEKVEDLRAIRDRHFDEIKVFVRGLRDVSWPAWLRERFAFVRAPGKLAAVFSEGMRRYRAGERFEGDEHLLRGLALWAHQDRHLYAWEAHQRDRRLGYRNDHYRVFAARLAQRYATIVLEDFKLQNLARAPKTENGDPSTGRTQRRQRGLGAVGSFRESVVKAAAKYGAAIVYVNPRNTSKRCHVCGRVSEWEMPSELTHTCSLCGVTWDRDLNASKNLLALAASGEVVRRTP